MRARWPAPTEAVRLIDMTAHHGGHPRMGAADVIPFMPVARRDAWTSASRSRGTSAGTLAETLDMPVYLYDRAALVARASLAGRRPQGRVRGAARRRRARRAPARLRAARDRTGGSDGGRRAQAARGVQRLPRRHRRGGGEGDRARRARVVGRPARPPRDRVRRPRAGWLVTVSMNLRRPRGHRAADGVRRRGGAGRRARPADRGERDRRARARVGARGRRRGVPSARGVRPRPADPGAAAGRRGRGVARDGRAAGEQERWRGSSRRWRRTRRPRAGARRGAVSGATGAALIAMVGRLTVGKEGFADVEDRMRAFVERADDARDRASWRWPTATRRRSTA